MTENKDKFFKRKVCFLPKIVKINKEKNEKHFALPKTKIHHATMFENMEKKILIFPQKNAASQQKKSNIEVMEACFDVKEAQLTHLSLIQKKTRHTIIAPLESRHLPPHAFGKPYLFHDKKSEIIPTNKKNQWKCERWETMEKKGASSIRFFLHNTPDQPSDKISLELTYTLNWLDHLVINYRLKTPQTQPLMIPHPIAFDTKNAVNILFNEENVVLWHEWEKKKEKTRCAFILKALKNDPLALKRVAYWTTKSKNKALTIDVHTSAQAVECVTLQPQEKKPSFWINAFDFHIDNKHKEMIVTNEKICDEPVAYTPQFPFTLKQTDHHFYDYSTLFYFCLS